MKNFVKFLFRFFDLIMSSILRFTPTYLVFFSILFVFILNFLKNMFISFDLDEEKIYLFILLVLCFFFWFSFENFVNLFIVSRINLIKENFQKALIDCKSNVDFCYDFIKDALYFFFEFKEYFFNLTKILYFFFFCVKIILVWSFFIFSVSEFKNLFFCFSNYNIFVLDNNFGITELFVYIEKFTLLLQNILILSFI